MSVSVFEKAYHFTHVDNLPSIVGRGLLSHNAVQQLGLGQHDISNHGVQARRASRRDPINGRSIHDYVPLYFNPRNPMLYCLRGLRDQLVMLEVSIPTMMELRPLFTDGNAACGATGFTNELGDLDGIRDVLYGPTWHEYFDGKRIRCAEILVPDRLEISRVGGIYGASEALQDRCARELGVDVGIDRGLFFQ